MSNLQAKVHAAWQRLGLLVGLSLLLFPSPNPIWLNEETPALALVGPVREELLPALLQAGLAPYTYLYAPAGGLYLLAPADRKLQRNLFESQLYFQVLETPAYPPESYVLLYGRPADLDRAAPLGTILWRLDRFAIARIAESDRPALPGLGLKVRRAEAALPTTMGEAKSRLEVEAITPGPVVQEMLNQVDANALRDMVGALSGAWPATVDGSSYTFSTRYTLAETPIKKATRYAYEFFQSLGLPSDYDYYSLYGLERRNVLAEQPGQTQPGQVLLLTAHLDSYALQNPSISAPGADDNASGAAALMHIASILRSYHFSCTIRYALFTGEEQGMYGSAAYALKVKQRGEDLRGVLNLDMLAYNSTGSAPTMEIHTRPANASDLAIASAFANASLAYNLNLTPIIYQDGEQFSDHASFWIYNYPAVLVIEDWEDHTPYYHTANDRLSSLNQAYFTEMTRASLATLAHLGCLLDGHLQGVARDQVSSLPIPFARVEAWQGGQKIATTTTAPDGGYLFRLPAGVYQLKFFAIDHRPTTIGDLAVNLNQVTQQDASLQPCQTVKGTNFSFSPSAPAASQTITFTATTQGGELPISYSWDFGDAHAASGNPVYHSFSIAGMYLVQLTADNTCTMPETVAYPVFLDVELSYLPMVRR